ncbi:MAG: autotransporter outer membrane beta-barrel domain-containing protein [Gammaproteobacteria bacterium]|nr:autotransporter outer membrane beta-barrel domain-containing protein [Gammaproteobacteria bacterium]
MAVALLAGLQPAYAQATLPGFPGTFTGNATVTASMCTNPADNETEIEPLALTFTALTDIGGFLTTTGTGSSDDTTISITLQFRTDGVIDAGALTAIGPDSTTTVGVTSGALSGGNLSFTFTGVETYPMSSDICQIDGSASLGGSGGGGTIIVPEVTPSATVTTPQVLTRSVTKAVDQTFGRIGAVRRGRGTGATDLGDGFMLQGGSGIAAGDGFASPLGAWVSYTYADFENDFAPTAFSGDRHTGFAGIDFNPVEDFIFGLALGYESADQSTAFNGGESQTDGFTVLPYVGYAFNDTFSVDVSMGYTAVDIEQFRIFGGERISSEVDADRFFWGGNLNGNRQLGNWFLSGRIGMIWAREYQDAYQETNEATGALLSVGEQTFKLGQWRVGGEAAYTWNDWEPYASATYQRDYSATQFSIAGTGPQPSNDRDDLLFSAGIRYFGSNNLSGFFEYNRIISRDNYEEDNFSLLLRYDFD